MLDALWSAASGMLAQQTALDVIANNLANVNTVGFKEGRTAFEDLLYNDLRPKDGSAQGNQMGLGTAISAVQIQYGAGQAMTTGQVTDLRIDGAGFFRVRKADGSTAYTRAGNLQIDAAGQLTTADGDLVLDQAGNTIVFPKGYTPNSISFEPSGTIRVDTPAGTAQLVATLGIATFTNPAGLSAIGQNQFVETANSGAATIVRPGSPGAGSIVGGQLEMSNVSAVDEMVNMITTQRAYEAVAKVVQASDEMLNTANGLRR
jgi:flagellar basal-body rod protein FlgG